MKRHRFFMFATGAAAFVATFAACSQRAQRGSEETAVTETAAAEPVELKEYGPAPTVLDIEACTIENKNFRTTLWTGSNLQLTLMSIPVGGEIGLECHSGIDQFLRIEAGKGEVRMGDEADKLDFVREARADYAVFVPAGMWHNIVNTGDVPLQIYSIYAPAEHPAGTVHVTQAEALEAEQHHHH